MTTPEANRPLTGDGWIAHDGGPNPAPGLVVDWKNEAGMSATRLSDEVAGLGQPLRTNSRITHWRPHVSRPTQPEPERDGAVSYDDMVALYNERTGPMQGHRDDYASWPQVPISVQSAVIAYDAARRGGSNEAPMSERNALSIAGMMRQALTATTRGFDDAIDDDLRRLRERLSTAERQRDEARAEHERDMEEMAKAAQNLQSQRIALFTAVTALRETRERIKTWPLDDNETCMCGSPVEGHSIGSGHAPVSQGDHAISLLVESIDEALQSIGSGE